MQKELVISTTAQETKIAILEDDELVEFYIERHRSQGIVGNIYKGKVTKVLPGMQSAFVDIGLDRDAFLYVSDFFEDTEEYDKIVSTVEEEVAQLQEGPPRLSLPMPLPKVEPPLPPLPVEVIVVPQPKPAPVEEIQSAAVAPAPPRTAEEPFDSRGPRRKDRDRRGKKPKIPSFETKSYEPKPEERTFGRLEVLPGESLAKYTRRTETTAESSGGSAAAEEDKDAHLGAVAEEPAGHEAGTASDAAPARLEEFPARETAVPSDATEGGVITDASIPTSKEGTEEKNEDENPSSSARISDRSDNYRFAHRSSSRRPRRGRGGPPPGPPGPPGSPGKPEEHRTNGPSLKASPMISELLREGQEILVQVSKEPLGKKGARITSHIALPGRYLVYMPTVDHVGVSRKIASDEERQRLKRIIHDNRNGLPGGFIVRTAAEGRTEGEFVQDIRFLGNLWADIRSKSEKKSAPTLIHRDLNLVQRLLRDQLSQDYRAIRLDNEAEFATVLDFVNKFQPALVNRVKLHLKDTPILEEYGLNTEIDKALRPKVWLKSGGYIVINQTEALVAIDVNTGKFVGKSNRLEDTIVKTNVDAAHEIVRQIRLRNLGGIIVVDFIDMEEKKNRQRVMAALEEALRADRSPSKILQFNDFGLVAITRKRTQPSLERTLCKPCPYCNGSGWSKSAETICYDIQQEIKKMAHLLEGKEITVRLNPEVAKALKNGEFVSLHELEEWTKKDIVVKSDPLLHEEHFDIF